jgi:hypothetical protein
MVKIKNNSETNKNIFGEIVNADVRINYHNNVNFHFWFTKEKKDYYSIVDQIVNEEVVNMSDTCGKNTCKVLQKMFHSNLVPIHWQYFEDDRFSIYFFTENTRVLPYMALAEIRISDFDDTVELVVTSGVKKYTLKTTINQIMKCSKIEKHTIVKLREKGLV